MTKVVRLQTPLTKESIAQLRWGAFVEISGTVYTARDAAHQRMQEAIQSGNPLPFPLQGQIVYYAGPTPAKPGAVIGSCGPTTAGRMDAYTPQLLELGLLGMIGKGPRSAEVVEAMKAAGAVYFAAIGGAAAVCAQSIVSAEVVAYDDLGPEAIRCLELKNYPAVVAVDSQGNSIYELGPASYRKEPFL